jgi:hypothetical protein
MGPRAVLDAVVKRKIPNSRRESNRRTGFWKCITKIEKNSTGIAEIFSFYDHN